MKKNDREKFHELNKTREEKTFNYRYCKSDVAILRRGCMKLKEIFIEIANIASYQSNNVLCPVFIIFHVLAYFAISCNVLCPP